MGLPEGKKAYHLDILNISKCTFICLITHGPSTKNDSLLGGKEGLIPLTGPLYGVKTIKQVEMSQGTI